MDYTTEALGSEIKDRRERLGMSQEALGTLAGYQKGAGVSISRIESGLTRPTEARLKGIADGLGVTVEQLEKLAKIRSDQNAEVDSQSDFGGVDRKRSIEERRKEIEERTMLRTERIDDLAASLEQAHKRACDAFFMRFIDIAGGIEGALLPPEPSQEEQLGHKDGARDARAIAVEVNVLSREIATLVIGGIGGAAAGAGVGRAAAYATFTGVARFGKASTGTPIARLAGIAASNATLARLGGGTLANGGGGAAAGSLVLTTIVAAPIAILFAGGLYFAHRRNKAQQAKYEAELDAAEASLDATRDGYELLSDILVEATATLEYIAVHAAHALEKWEQGLGARPVAWMSLTDEQRRSYAIFIKILACEVTIDSIEAQQFMTTDGDDLKQLKQDITNTLNYVATTVRSLV